MNGPSWYDLELHPHQRLTITWRRRRRRRWGRAFGPRRCRVMVLVEPRPWRWRLGARLVWPATVAWPRVALGPLVVMAMPLRDAGYLARRHAQAEGYGGGER